MKLSSDVKLLVSLAKAQASLTKLFQTGCLGSLTFNEFLLLLHIDQHGENGIARIQLAHKVGLSASGVTRLLLPMEKIHLIKNDINERDARMRLVHSTPAGKERLVDALDRLDAYAPKLLPDSTKKDRNACLEVLTSMAAHANML